MESVLVNEVIEAAELYAAERIPLSKIQLVQALDPMVESVHADSSLLRYVFFSMIVNAVSHLHGVGVVNIVSKADSEGAVIVTVATFGAEDQDGGNRRPHDSLFTEKLKKAGTGLPLPIVRDIIEGQGGSLLWESDGVGELKFTLSFPSRSDGRAGNLG